MNVWEQIKNDVDAGKDPVVFLEYSMLASVVNPEKKRRGKAPTPREGMFSLYSKTPYGARKTQRTRCWNPYCRKLLSGRYVCGDWCKALALEHLNTAIYLLTSDPVGEPKEVPLVPIYDEDGRDRTAAERVQEGEARSARRRKPKFLREAIAAAGNRNGKRL